MGPLTTMAGVEKAAAHTEDAKSHGGQIISGENNLSGNAGYFFEPTIIKFANENMQIAQEETFGPVCALFSFKTEDEAVEAANKTSVC